VSGGYFARLRALAAGGPARRAAPRDRARPAELLEQEEVRVAPSPSPALSGPPPEPVEAPARLGDPPSAAAPPSTGPAERPPAESEPLEVEVLEPRAWTPMPSATAAAAAPRVPRRMPDPETALEPAARRSAAASPSTSEAAHEAPPPAPGSSEAASRRPSSPEEGLHEALVRVRHWMAEPEAEAQSGERPAPDPPAAPAPLRAIRPRRADPGRSTAAALEPAAAIEQRTEVSIGTIHVTVEEPEGGARHPGARPVSAAAPARPRAVPRHYVRGW